MATISETFWDWVDQSGGPDACWPWTRARLPGGYGVVWNSLRQEQVGAHRVAFERASGTSLAAGEIVRHTCDFPPCCNPRHLLRGSYADNRRDQIERNRLGDSTPINPCRGEDMPRAKLTDEIVRDLRRNGLGGRTISQVARDLGVSRTTLDYAYKGVTWKHIRVEEVA